MPIIKVNNCRTCDFLQSDEDGLYPECHITDKKLKTEYYTNKLDYNDAVPKWCPLHDKEYIIILSENVNIYEDEE